MNLRIPVALAALVGVLTPVSPLTAQCVFNQVCPAASTSGQVNFVTAASFDGGAGGGTLVLSGIPAGAVIVSARFYCESSQGSFVGGAVFNGIPITPSQIGLGLGTAAAKHARSYVSNVTGLIHGDGSYPYTVSGGVNSGAGLLVVYEDCNVDGTYQIELHEGYNPGVFVDTSDGPWPNSTVFSGFTVDGSASPDAEVSFFVMNGMPGQDEEYFFQGQSLACCDPASNLFEFERYDVSGFLSGGETSATLDISELGNSIGVSVALFRVRTSAPSGPPVPVSYCTAGISANGCQATLSAAGTPSATAASGFTLSATNLDGVRSGMFLFNDSGRQATPWGTGTSYQCVAPPLIGGGLMISSGTPGLCDGAMIQDLNALWCPTCPRPAKNPGSGALVQAQLWYRDPLSTSSLTTSLSDAIEFCVGP